MLIVLALLMLLVFGYLLWCLIGALFASGRRKLKLKRSGLAFGGLIALVIISAVTLDKEAVDEGFEGSGDKALAEEAGITDPLVWKTKKQAVLAKAADDAKRAAQEKKRTAEAEALQAEADRKIAELEEAKAKTEKEVDCRSDLQCWGEKAALVASFSCPPYIEKLAKFDFEWTDGWIEPKFGRYRWKDKEKGFVTLIGDKLKLQNGFGAWKHMQYTCDIDPITEQVLDVSVF